MALSVTAPLETAFGRTGKILFKPFEASKWFTLGFCAFLAQLADCGGGGGGGSGAQFDGSGHSTSRSVERFSEWFAEHQALILTLGSLALLLIVALTILVVWLQSRGRFMFLDGVVRNRGAVSEPWHEYRREGNSLFRFSVVLALTGLLIFLVATGVAALLAWSDLRADRFGGGAIAGLIVGVGSMVVTGIAFALVDLFTKDFVVPAMYARRINVMAAWRVVLAEVLQPHMGVTALYVLMKILIAIVLGLIAMTVMCGTLGVACCLLAIPYIGTVVMLPLLVFERSYSLAFLDQLGGTWRLVGEPVVPPAPLP